MSTVQTETHIHTFEQSGLGIAPFKVVGIWDMPSRSLLEHNPEAWNNALRTAPCRVGSCHYCGHELIVHFIIKSSDSKIFAVGSECVRKTGEKGLIDKMKALQKARDREIRRAKQAAACIARLEEQRQRNNGLTDYELQEQQRLEAARLHLERLKPVIALLSPLADEIADGADGFCDSIAASLRRGELPRGRGYSLTVDILASRKGRRNSNAYKTEDSRVSEILGQAADLLETIN